VAEPESATSVVEVDPEQSPADGIEALGEFIRAQRKQAELSLRELAAKANVSNPYISQIERGLHEPSVRVLTAIAKALDMSSDALLARAGLLESDGGGDHRISTEAAIISDAQLTPEQRDSLLSVYRNYTAANRARDAQAGVSTDSAVTDSDPAAEPPPET
jgi:transcriptional regulator with XRE-family HTH domain